MKAEDLKNNIQYALDFIFEMGMLRRVARTGWKFFLTENIESENVAEHITRTAQLGFIIAVLEGYHNPDEVVTICVFHDSHETRTWDANKVMRRYLVVDERKAAMEQYSGFTNTIKKMLMNNWDTVEEQRTTAGKIAKDADILEGAFTAREYEVSGHPTAVDWIDHAESRLHTESAKKLLFQLKSANPNNWWKDLKEFNY